MIGAILKWLRARTGIQDSWPLSSGTHGSELYEMLTGGTSGAGVVVNERTAMTVSAVYACVRLIACTIATLPCTQYRRTDSGRARVETTLSRLLNFETNAAMSASVFWEYWVTSMLLGGDGFAQIMRAPDRAINSGDVIALEPVHWGRIDVWRMDGRIKYTVRGSEKQYVVDQDDMLHLSGVGFDGLRSLSPLRHAARQAIGIALAADEYSARFFSNGARPDVALEIPGTLTEDQITLLRQKWTDRYGGLDNSRAPAILAGGMKIHELTLNAEDAQLIATRQFQIADIARVFGVPPWMVGETEKQTSWGAGIEQTGIGFLKYTLGPHLTRMEQEINRKLLRDGRSFVEFNRDGLMEGDSKAQAEYFGKALGGPGAQGWMSVNEVRRLKNMQPQSGDAYDRVRLAEKSTTAPTGDPQT